MTRSLGLWVFALSCIFCILLIIYFEYSSILIVVGSLVNVAYFSWRNKVKKLPEVRAKLLEKYVTAEKEDDGGLEAWIELGDRHPDFMYTL